MRVLVSAASKHGATSEVAVSIAAALTAAGVEAVVVAPAGVTSVEGFDAAVIGSAVYVGRWLEPARELLEQHCESLAKMPVWLFSSGPIGDPPKPIDEPLDVAAMIALVGARGHRVIPGRIDKKLLGLGEKAILAAVRAPEGDYRPWPDIEAWANELAAELRGVPEPAASR